MKVLDFPLTKITLCFLAGILTSYCFETQIFTTTLILVITAILFFITYFTASKSSKNNSFFGIFTYLISFQIGIITLSFHTESRQKTNYSNNKKAFEKTQLLTLTLREKLKSNDANERYIALFNQIDHQATSGKIIINIEKDSSRNTLIIGNTIRLKAIVQPNNPPKNPNQFNYSQYLKDKQIYGQIYASKSEISISKNIKKDIWYYAAQLHARIIYHLEKTALNPEEMNVALALILGQRQEISSEIIQDYQYSGATHILSVSGLHVGFIMSFITFILKPIPNTRKGSLLKLTAILISLFLFAIISGLSPSVLRSVVMFSFLAIGSHLRRRKNTYHTLLISILLILLFEPYFLFDIGFQLSYLALFFIIWLQPVLKDFWKPKNIILVTIWNILTVSFAAQIGTLPLCLYYFHQFPGLFFVTNIIIVPLISLIMIVGIIVMLFAVFISPPSFLIQILEKSIYFLNQIIHFIASFDSFVIRDISFNNYLLFSFYSLIILGVLYLKRPHYAKLAGVLTAIIVLQISFILTKKDTQSQQELIVYNLKKKTIITERSGKKVTIFGKNTYLKSIAKNKILNSYLVGNFSHLDKSKTIPNILFFKSKKILIIDSSGVYTNKMNPDVLVLTDSPKINLDRLLQELRPKIIVADASNSYSMQKLWKNTCLKQKIPFHATTEKGYYKLSN